MTIRPATDHDIPAIVGLLRISLGESLMPKSEGFWRWKHADNPFGKSPVLLAFENDLLIGVRAFMRWEWKQGNKIFKAVRAVDTATHPDYQGKGIFKTLTLQLADQCKLEGVDFIFNTPNKSSKPGYLKMGWTSQGKMKLYLKPLVFTKAQSARFELDYSIGKMAARSIQPESLNSSALTTHVTSSFLNWRYAENPNIRYYHFSNDVTASGYLTIFRLKKFRWGTEFRICEHFTAVDTMRSEYQKHLKEVVSASGANLISSALPIRLFPEFSLLPGPEITTRPLSFDHNFLTFNFWKPSLGDMEVF
jgi:GNAT superfamily N-acetyltransferase